jgi:ketosteroid isomerase-like protein
MRSRLAALTAAILLLTGTTHAQDTTEELRRLDREIAVATWTADPVWFAENLTDDFVLITPGGMRRTKRDVIDELATPGLKMDAYEPTEVQIRVYGDAGIVTGRILQRFTLGGIRYANDLRYTDVYVRRKGRWYLATVHTSTVAVRR